MNHCLVLLFLFKRTKDIKPCGPSTRQNVFFFRKEPKTSAMRGFNSLSRSPLFSKGTKCQLWRTSTLSSCLLKKRAEKVSPARLQLVVWILLFKRNKSGNLVGYRLIDWVLVSNELKAFVFLGSAPTCGGFVLFKQRWCLRGWTRD